MASDRAYINRGIWNDADHRQLTLEAQHLYYMLLTHPTLSYVGVVDWRPNRLTPFARGLTVQRIEAAAAELSAGLYVVIDEATEEVLIRSWVKHDGVLKQPRLAVSMANAYTRTASNELRGVIVHELRRQREAHPEYACWEDKRVTDVLSQPSISAEELPPFAPAAGANVGGGFGDGFTPNPPPEVGPGLLCAPSPTPTPAPPSSTEEGESEGKSRKRSSAGTRISDDFTIDDEMRAWAAENTPHVDIDWHTQKFIDHFASQSGQRGVKTQWGRTWKNWMRTEEERAPANRQQQRPNRDAASARGLVQAHEDLFGRTT
ncbi:hypothetical protein [Brachybacterium massiliense]|uniref:hypothetical protein n=1 Tax=Brachybacterium massiliense TaxID=1755098 RepID=UPI000B3BBF8F|nr:hypothetical protein [Brachybacterium massiliense]